MRGKIKMQSSVLVFIGGLFLLSGCTHLPLADKPAREEISGWVGAHQLTLRAPPVDTAAVFRVGAGAAEFVAVTEVYPESPQPVSYHYLVSAPGLATFERHYSALGFGPVTYFLRVTRQPVGPITLTNLAGAGSVPRILGVRTVTHDEIAKAQRADRFTLSGMINPHQGKGGDEQLKQIAERLAADPKRNISRAFSCEIFYANRDAGDVRRQLEMARQRSRASGLPVLLGMVSWWSGTPRNVPDGLGGKFDDLQYQQICYTPDAVHPENAELRKLLGDRYDSHYCLTTPNLWSDTPWLTMNRPQLNAYRARRMREAVNLLKEVSDGDTSWVAGIFLENEPRYWDTQATQGTKYHCGERWADFNPCTVAAASHDGVTLNPADGLSLEELAWLQKNAGRYFQDTVDMLRRPLSDCGWLGRFPIYTHSFQTAMSFPGSKINRSCSDWSRVIGARAGLEGMWSQPSDYERVREWGAWCNLNREETDGRPIETHLWDLRTDYAMGGELFNSYNWHKLKPNAYFNYARDFLDNLPSVTLPPPHARLVDANTISLTPPKGLQAFTRITVPVKNISARADKGLAVALSIDGGTNRTWFSERQILPTDGRQLMTFVFPVPAEVNWQATGILRLRAHDVNSVEVGNVAAFAADAAQKLSLAYDLEQSRTLSQLIIRWKQAATGLPTPTNRTW